MQQFLDAPVVEREAVIQPDRVPDDGHRETVAVRFRVSHGRSAYPDPVKATQPYKGRHVVKCNITRFKDFRALATRYKKQGR